MSAQAAPSVQQLAPAALTVQQPAALPQTSAVPAAASYPTPSYYPAPVPPPAEVREFNRAPTTVCPLPALWRTRTAGYGGHQGVQHGLTQSD